MSSAASVLLIGNFLSGSAGARGVCEDVEKRLRGRGWQVFSASRRKNRFLRLADMMASAWLFRTRYRVAQVDVFSGPAFFWAEASCWVLRRAGRPYVLTLHGGNLPQFACKSPRRVARLLASAAAVTSPSPYLAEQLRGLRDGISVLPNAIDVASYPFRLRSRPRPRLAWVRAFHRIYNPDLAVRTLGLLREEVPNARLTMIGPDKGDGSFESARKLALELKLTANIDFVPGVPKSRIPLCLDAADIMLNTADIDNAPVSVVEAMACGLCVVSTDAGGLRHLISEGQDGLLAPRGNPRALCDNVIRVLADGGLAARLSRQARSKAQEHDWSRVLPRWESLLARVAGEAAE